MSDGEKVAAGEGRESGDDRSSLARAWDIARYAPIGILFDGVSQLPKFAERGKVHVRNARFVGEIVVRQGGQQVRAWLDSGSPSREEGDGSAGTNGSSPESAPADLAIPGYEDLPASEVVSRLPDLSPEEREAVGRFEAAHRGRKTVLNKVAQLRS